MRIIPAILDKYVEKLKAQGKSESSAVAICTASLKKSGKLNEDLIEELAEVKEGTYEFEEFETYLQENALVAWSAPTKRKEIPSSHFFDSENKRYPFRNPDGSVNSLGVMAAWKLANNSHGEFQAFGEKVLPKIKLYKDRLNQTSDKQKENFHRFSSPISESFLENLQFSDKPTTIDIQCLRMGKFKHPWYGTLNFDQKFFDSLVKNFEADIPNPEIAFDFSHQPDLGAAAWINKTFVEENNLMANVTLTEKGEESLRKKEFKYFSIEYTDDYVEYEFSEGLDDKGNVVERETKISHGPTILGGGLTNRPFIKGMAPVSLHDAGEIIALEEVIDDKSLQSTKEVKESMEKTLEELQTERDELKDKIKELEAKEDDSLADDLEDLNVQLSDISAAVKTLSEKGDGDATKALDELNKTKEELEKANKKLEEEGKTSKQLSEKVSTLADTVKKLMESNKVLHEDKHRISVQKKLGDFRKLGAFPATLKIIEKISLEEAVRDFSVTLSEGEGAEKKDVEKTFFDVVDSLLESIPEDHRFTEAELSESVINPTGSGKETSVEEVEAYAKEKGMEFSEALVAFSKEGKIE